MYDHGTRGWSAARDRWLRRLRRTFLAVPAAAALAAVGLTAIFARHDALRTAPVATSHGDTHASGSQLAGDDHEGGDDGGEHRRAVPHPTHTPSPALTSSGVQPPVTHTGGS